jgi:ABC-2 type transport system permease protein
MKKRSIDITEFILLTGIVILVNIIVSQYFFRIDLTEDKRYTISENSKQILKGLDDVVFVEVYLDGELPSDYKRLQRSIRETLDEFRVYTGNKLQYKFMDPNDDEDEERKSRVYQYLTQKGIQPMGISTNDGEKYIFPGAQIVYKEKEFPLMLLKGSRAGGEAEMVNQSIEGIEYELISVIRQLNLKNKKSIGFVEGHGEFKPESLIDLTKGLSQFYNVYSVDLQKIKQLDNYEALVIARPQEKYTEEEKFVIDQYIMNGGKVLFLIDALRIHMDSIGQNGTLAIPYEHNLDDMLFKYGLRLNPDLIQDLQSVQIPLYVGTVGDRPQIKKMPWRYYPLLNNFGKHTTVKNVDIIYSKFAGTIDTVKAPGIKKTPLVFTSKYTQVYSAPVRVDFNEARRKVDPMDFDKGSFPVAFLLEGKFSSLYKNRPLPLSDVAFKEEGNNCKVFVCSDADIIRNEITRKGQQLQEVPLPQGNKDFISNMIDYMLDDQGLINVRAKEITLRPLDKIKIKEEKTFWQIINLVLPVFLIVVFGIIRYYLRKKKYENF